MKVITGDSTNINKLKGLKLLEFKISETIFKNGKVVITSWEAKVED